MSAQTYDHLDHCPICAGKDRATAYRWLGESHWIPGLHGANWIGQDLRRTVEALAPGGEATLDYGADTGAPRITLRRSVDDVITADSTPSAQPGIGGPWPDREGRTDAIVHAVLTYLITERRAVQVVPIPPQS